GTRSPSSAPRRWRNSRGGRTWCPAPPARSAGTPRRRARARGPGSRRAPSATPASRAPRCGSIPSATCSSSCSRTASTPRGPTGRSSPCARGWPTWWWTPPPRAMSLAPADWLILAAYFVLSGAIGLYYTRRAGRSVAEYFVSGRTLPWWLAGTSMVATTFAADTPLVVSGLVAKYGVAGNWLWWNLALSGMLTVFLFARLWRRAGVMTDVEFAELRYGGRPAALLRGARALYLGLPINLIIMGWVTRAMVIILHEALGRSGLQAAVVLLVVTAGYSMLAGLWGVVMTDLFQFVFAMGGSIVLAA